MQLRKYGHACLLVEDGGARVLIDPGSYSRGFEEVEGLTAVLVTHDLSEAFLLADRVAVLREGRLEQIGPAGELRAAPATPYVRELLRRARVA